MLAWQILTALILSWPPGMPQPFPPPQPSQYTQRFSMTDGSTGVIYYDFPNRRQRIDHVNNTASHANQCFEWFNRTDDCVEYFVSDEQYVYFPSDGSCCLESCADVCPQKMRASDGSCCREAALGVPKPDSIVECRPNGTSELHGEVVDLFLCPACLDYYFSATPPQTALRFADRGHHYAVDFDPSSLRRGAPVDSLLELPASCSPHVKCRGPLGRPNTHCDPGSSRP